MKKLSTIIFLVAVILAALCMTPALALKNSLYFVVGSPDPNVSALFPVNVTRLNDSGLQAIREVVDRETGSVAIRAYYDERVVVVKSTSYAEETDRTIFSFINMDDPLMAQRASVNYSADKVSDQGSHLFSIPKGQIYQGVEFFDKAELKKFYGVNLKTMEKTELPFEIYKDIILSGVSGGGVLDQDVTVGFVTEKGYIRLGRGYNWVDTNWKLPPNIKYKKNKTVTIYVNNKDVLVLAPSDEREKETNGFGHSNFYVFNKGNEKWHSVQIKGDYTEVRGFGKWLGGYVAVYDKKKQSAGKGKRRQQPTKSGIPVDWWLEDRNIYAPGILFIYNSDTQKKYEIDTGQGDSEVLLVEGDYVYYRVYDEIYKSKIGKNKPEEPVLLVKDDVVPDIHWAFFGPKVDIPAEKEKTE